MVHARRAARENALLIGGHIDSVPNGGWLDGCLNVARRRRGAAAGSPRRATPPVTVRLVNWADEEGARFGRSLFGSSAAAGSMRDQDELAQARRSRRRRAARRARRRTASTLDRALEARVAARERAAPTSSCTSSRARCSSRWTCRSASCSARSASSARGSPGAARPRTPGSTPMDKRRDALAGAAKLALDIREIAAEVGGGAVCTSGGVVCRPGIVTSVVETAEQLLDQRHLDAGEARADARAGGEGGSERFAARGEHRGRVGADLADRADPLRRRADRARRRVDPRGRRHLAPAPVRARSTTPPRSPAPASRR